MVSAPVPEFKPDQSLLWGQGVNPAHMEILRLLGIVTAAVPKARVAVHGMMTQRVPRCRAALDIP